MPTILVIDDNSQLLNLVRTALERTGHKVLQALNANDGLAIAEKNPIDLVITDLAMPEKDGFSLIEELRSTGYEGPILASSGGMGTSPKDFLEAARQIGANATLPKPFKIQDLLKLVSELLSQSHKV